MVPRGQVVNMVRSRRWLGRREGRRGLARGRGQEKVFPTASTAERGSGPEATGQKGGTFPVSVAGGLRVGMMTRSQPRSTLHLSRSR